MYQGHSNIISSRSVYSSEKESSLILSTDAKPRLKWTPELHERFIEAVAQLGGPDSKYTIFRVQKSSKKKRKLKIECNAVPSFFFFKL
jgi:hypothetical protein